jgi:hypothetical protein
MRWVRQALWGLAAAALAWAAPAAASSLPSVAKEVVVLEASPPRSVSVFEEVTLAAVPSRPWIVPLPVGAQDVSPQSQRVSRHSGQVVAQAGVRSAAVVYTLPATLGSVFVQETALPAGGLTVLAGPGVYPGLGTGLTLRGQTRIGGHTFTYFTGGAYGPLRAVHFALTLGQPGQPWADALTVLLVLWLMAGAYAGARRLSEVMRRPVDEGGRDRGAA